MLFDELVYINFIVVVIVKVWYGEIEKLSYVNSFKDFN